jgi:hypothetical protein
MIEKDSFLMGIVLGCIVPVLGFVAIEGLFDLLTNTGLMTEVTPLGTTKRMRTLALMALCCNLIPFHIAKKNYWEDTMRGMILPTLIYAGFWVYKFGGSLF